MKNHFNIAIVGLGNIGSEVLRYLNKNKKNIERTTNSTFSINYLSARNLKKKRGSSISKKLWIKNPVDLVKKKKC